MIEEGLRVQFAKWASVPQMKFFETSEVVLRVYTLVLVVVQRERGGMEKLGSAAAEPKHEESGIL
jgi:hypothetical protein